MSSHMSHFSNYNRIVLGVNEFYLTVTQKKKATADVLMKPDWFVELCVIKLSCLGWLQLVSISPQILADQEKGRNGKPTAGSWKEPELMEERRDWERESIRRKSLGWEMLYRRGLSGSQRGIDIEGTGESGGFTFHLNGMMSSRETGRRRSQGPAVELR